MAHAFVARLFLACDGTQPVHMVIAEVPASDASRTPSSSGTAWTHRPEVAWVFHKSHWLLACRGRL